MRAKTLAAAEGEVERPYLRVALLGGVVLFLEGYDIAAVGYAIPSLVDVWRVNPSVFTVALTAGNVGLLLGSTGAGLLGDRVGRKPMLICCVAVFGVFSLLSGLAGSPTVIAANAVSGMTPSCSQRRQSASKSCERDCDFQYSRTMSYEVCSGRALAAARNSCDVCPL